MEYFTVEGNENVIITALSKYLSEGGARLMLRSLPLLTNILSDDEFYQESCQSEDSDTDSLELIIPKTNYYINIKMTTIAFIGLLLDIEYTHGFSEFILNIFGITADVIKKLSNEEKCVLLLIKSNSIIVNEDKYILDDLTKCVNPACQSIFVLRQCVSSLIP